MLIARCSAHRSESQTRVLYQRTHSPRNPWTATPVCALVYPLSSAFIFFFSHNAAASDGEIQTTCECLSGLKRHLTNGWAE